MSQIHRLNTPDDFVYAGMVNVNTKGLGRETGQKKSSFISLNVHLPVLLVNGHDISLYL